jgi:hypothetical protein
MSNEGLIMRVTIMPPGRELEGVEYFPDPSALFDGTRCQRPTEVEAPTENQDQKPKPKKSKPLTLKEAKYAIRLHFEERMGIPRIAKKMNRGLQAITDTIEEEKKKRMGAG